MFMGINVQDSGYNHSSALLAFGEARMLAGWTDEVFALEWHQQFKDAKNLTCRTEFEFSHVLNERIHNHFPKLVEVEFDFNAVQLDFMHHAHALAQAQAPLPDIDDQKSIAPETK